MSASDAYCGVATPFSGCAYPFFPRSCSWSSVAANITFCDVTIASDKPEEFLSFRLLGSFWSGVLLILLIFERFVLTAVSTQQRVDLGERTTLCRQFFVVRSFKSRTKQIVAALAILNTFRAFDLRGSSNLLSPMLMILLDELALVLVLLAAMLYLASVTGALLKLQPRVQVMPRLKRGHVTMILAGIPAIQMLLAFCDGIPRIGVTFYVVRMTVVGLFCISVGIIALVVSIIGWYRQLTDPGREDQLPCRRTSITGARHMTVQAQADVLAAADIGGHHLDAAGTDHARIEGYPSRHGGSEIYSIINESLRIPFPSIPAVLPALENVHAPLRHIEPCTSVTGITADPQRSRSVNLRKYHVAPFFMWVIISSAVVDAVLIALGSLYVMLAMKTGLSMPARPPPFYASLVRPSDLWTTPLMLMSFWLFPALLACANSTGAFVRGPSACFSHLRSGCPNCCIACYRRQHRVYPSKRNSVTSRRLDRGIISPSGRAANHQHALSGSSAEPPAAGVAMGSPLSVPVGGQRGSVNDSSESSNPTGPKRSTIPILAVVNTELATRDIVAPVSTPTDFVMLSSTTT
jgi:uncharacterized membrane protein YidH (DUF202 family)